MMVEAFGNNRNQILFGAIVATTLVFSCGRRSSDPEPVINNDQNTPIPLPSELDCPTGTDLTWDNFAAQYMRRYCAGCHAGSLSGANRHGAPEDIVFDTYDESLSLRVEIIRFASDNNAAMPPGVKVPSDERALLREWLKCGAPN